MATLETKVIDPHLVTFKEALAFLNKGIDVTKSETLKWLRTWLPLILNQVPNPRVTTLRLPLPPPEWKEERTPAQIHQAFYTALTTWLLGEVTRITEDQKRWIAYHKDDEMSDKEVDDEVNLTLWEYFSFVTSHSFYYEILFPQRNYSTTTLPPVTDTDCKQFFKTNKTTFERLLPYLFYGFNIKLLPDGDIKLLEGFMDNTICDSNSFEGLVWVLDSLSQTFLSITWPKVNQEELPYTKTVAAIKQAIQALGTDEKCTPDCCDHKAKLYRLTHV